MSRPGAVKGGDRVGGGPPMTHVAKVVIILVYLTLPVNQMALCSSCHVE